MPAPSGLPGRAVAVSLWRSIFSKRFFFAHYARHVRSHPGLSVSRSVALQQVADLLVGPQGSTVKLRFLRPVGNSTKFVGIRTFSMHWI